LNQLPSLFLGGDFMLELLLNIKENRPYRVLCLGAHCDDIEIGCGGTILKLVERYKNLSFHWAVLSSNEIRAVEARNGAEKFLEPVEEVTIDINNFRNGYFPFVGAEIKDYFEKLKRVVDPDIIFSHYRNDLHQDHRLISELTWNTFRNHLILEYEIPKYDGDLGQPNFFVPLRETICQKKISKIMSTYGSQGDKHWFSNDLFMSILRLRGMEACSPDKFAEAFYCRKMNLSL
jgi:LmbE family N-acetylglucosaminyl deacetylase